MSEAWVNPDSASVCPAPLAHQLPNGVLCLCLLFHGVDYTIFAGCG